MAIAEIVASLVAAVAAHAQGGSYHRTPHGGNSHAESATVVVDAKDACTVTLDVEAHNDGADRGPSVNYRHEQWHSKWHTRWRLSLGSLRDIDVDEKEESGGRQDLVRLRGREPFTWERDPPMVGSDNIPRASGAAKEIELLVGDRAGGRAIAVAFKRAAAACRRH
jgi:hypothetical protein